MPGNLTPVRSIQSTRVQQMMKEIFNRPHGGGSPCRRQGVAGAFAKIKVLAPYAAIELVLPGGSMVALLLWLYRRQKNAGGMTKTRASLRPWPRWSWHRPAPSAQSNIQVSSSQGVAGSMAAENIS
jgi:hypothetical protein